LREGFGLTATEAMWKGAAVIAGDCGGLRHQVEDGDNGFLVTSVEAAAQRLVQLLQDTALRRKLGKKARESVRSRFLLTRKIEQYLDLFSGFEPRFTLNHRRDLNLATAPSPAGGRPARDG
jgi:trehalose synthase